MKTIRLLYPDYVSGALEQYYFGANLMSPFLCLVYGNKIKYTSEYGISGDS